MPSHSVDLRASVVRYRQSTGASYPAIASIFGVGEASVKRWVKQYNDTQNLAPRANKPGRKPALNEHGLALLSQLVAQHPDATLQELSMAYADQTDVRLAVCIVHRALEKLKITRKKSPPRVGKRHAARSGVARAVSG